MTGSYLLGNGVFHVFNKYAQNGDGKRSAKDSNCEKIDLEFEEYPDSDDFGSDSKNGGKNSDRNNESGKPITKPLPKVMLFPGDNLVMNWYSDDRGSGPGLVNLWNTCFMNSVLQVLSYTPPLWNYLISHNSESNFNENYVKLNDSTHNGSFCAHCSLSKLFLEMRSSQRAVSPNHIAQNISSIHRDMRIGRQEDAHEFLLSLLNSMREHFWVPKKMDKYTEYTQLVDNIFCGWTRNIVICGKCAHESVSFDPFLILHLDIEKCSALTSALSLFFSEQAIMGGRYDCEGCRSSTSAKLRTEVENAPNFLIIQFKRFRQASGYIYKNKNSVSFEPELDLAKFSKHSRDMKYRLYAVIVHVGSGCGSGHYYAYAESSPGQWLHLNDSSVQAVGLNRVLDDCAYLLFYRKTVPEIISPLKFNKSSQNSKQSFSQNNESDKFSSLNSDSSKILRKCESIDSTHSQSKKSMEYVQNTTNKASWNGRNKVNIEYPSKNIISDTHMTVNPIFNDNDRDYSNIGESCPRNSEPHHNSKKNKHKLKMHRSNNSLFKPNPFQNAYDRKYFTSYNSTHKKGNNHTNTF